MESNLSSSECPDAAGLSGNHWSCFWPHYQTANILGTWRGCWVVQAASTGRGLCCWHHHLVILPALCRGTFWLELEFPAADIQTESEFNILFLLYKGGGWASENHDNHVAYDRKCHLTLSPPKNLYYTWQDFMVMWVGSTLRSQILFLSKLMMFKISIPNVSQIGAWFC